MTDRFTAPSRLSTWLLCAPLLWACAVQAQGLRPSGQLNPQRSAAPVSATTTTQSTADFIVALVNSEPITNNEVRQRLLRVEQQIAQEGTPMPARDVLAREVLEQIINERAQMQQATELGITVDEAAVTQAEQSIAAQNQIAPDELRRRLAADGIDINRFRNDLRNQILLQRVREREVESKVRVTEAGRILADHARRVEADAARTYAEIDGQNGRYTQTVKVAGAPGFATYALPRKFAAFQAEHPSVRFNLHILDAGQVSESVRSAQADIGVTYSHIAEKDIAVFYAHPAEIVAVMRPDHPLAACESLHLTQLSAYPLALPDGGSALRQILDTPLDLLMMDLTFSAEIQKFGNTEVSAEY